MPGPNIISSLPQPHVLCPLAEIVIPGNHLVLVTVPTGSTSLLVPTGSTSLLVPSQLDADMAPTGQDQSP